MTANPWSSQELCCHVNIHQMYLVGEEKPVIRLHCNLQEKLLFMTKMINCCPFWADHLHLRQWPAVKAI